MPKAKATPPPKTPALVRRGVVAIAIGLGLSPAACGGKVEGTTPQPISPPKGHTGVSASDDAGLTEEGSAEAGTGLPPFVPEGGEEAGMDEGAAADGDAEAGIGDSSDAVDGAPSDASPPPPPVLPPPHLPPR